MKARARTDSSLTINVSVRYTSRTDQEAFWSLLANRNLHVFEHDPASVVENYFFSLADSNRFKVFLIQRFLCLMRGFTSLYKAFFLLASVP